MKLILLGPSGAGKGTLVDYIMDDFPTTHISTGMIFRKNIKERTPLGIAAEEYSKAGLWVPDDITVKMIFDRLKENDVKNGFILDGYPRTFNQANLLNDYVKIDLVIELDIEDEIVIERLSGRWICTKCEKNHNVKLGQIEQCRKCGADLYQREDDKEAIIRNRLASYHAEADAMSGFYVQRGNLVKIKITKDMMPIDVYNAVKPHLLKIG
ncbi:MAG: nucleoside monophosphate kinase [Firmicutes bacterium]|nr:nucleoside monophosphate kinase [Bacillota bacterium]